MKPGNLHVWQCAAILTVIFAHLLILLNARFTVWPEMILHPYLLNHGFALYRDIVTPYFPLLPLLLGQLFGIAGLSIDSLRAFTYAVVVLADLAVFWSAFKLSKNFTAAILSATLYVLLQSGYGGNGLWFELVLAPLLLSGLIILFYDSGSRLKVLAAGTLIGLSVLIKQNAAFFYLPAMYILVTRRQAKELVYLLLPGFAVTVVTGIWIFNAGLWQDFWNWAVRMTVTYSSQPGFVMLPAIRQYPYILFPALIAAGAILRLKKLPEKIYWLGCLLLALSFAFPRYENFHLQVLAALSAALSVFLPKKYWLAFAAVAVIIFGRGLVRDWQQPPRFLDSGTTRLASQISNYSSVYLLNGPELAYYLSGKLPPKPWATGFPWYFEQPGLQQRVIGSLKELSVEYIVVGEPIGGGQYTLGNYLPSELMHYISKDYLFVESKGGYQVWHKK